MSIIVLHEGTELPEEGTHYVVAANGIFIRKQNAVGTALINVDEIPSLQTAEPWATYDMPALPVLLGRQTLALFRYCFQELAGSEGVLLIHFNPQSKQFLLACPRQLVAPSELDYKADSHIPGTLLVGSIHSHGSGSAYHSCKDIRDEAEFDGIHCTFGRMDDENFEVSAQMVFNGTRFDVSPTSVFSGLTQVLVPEDGKKRPKKATVLRPSIYTFEEHTDNEQPTVVPDEWKNNINTLQGLKGRWLRPFDPPELEEFSDFSESDIFGELDADLLGEMPDGIETVSVSSLRGSLEEA